MRIQLVPGGQNALQAVHSVAFQMAHGLENDERNDVEIRILHRVAGKSHQSMAVLPRFGSTRIRVVTTPFGYLRVWYSPVCCCNGLSG
jgi:hypothetical protein